MVPALTQQTECQWQIVKNHLNSFILYFADDLVVTTSKHSYY